MPIVLAIKLGEPYGTLILTLSAISIEVVMISTAMLHGANNPTLGRDAIFAVIMIALDGLVGLSLMLGGCDIANSITTSKASMPTST